MTVTVVNGSHVHVALDNAVHLHSETEHFLNLNKILYSLIDFIRPETYIAQDELQNYNELKDKYLRESRLRRNKQQTSKSSLDMTEVESIRTTSGIHRFLAHYDSK